MALHKSSRAYAKARSLRRQLSLPEALPRRELRRRLTGL